MEFKDIYNREISDEEFSSIVKERRRKYDENRSERIYNEKCIHVVNRMAGPQCDLHEGSCGNYCWAYDNKECPFFEAEQK